MRLAQGRGGPGGLRDDALIECRAAQQEERKNKEAEVEQMGP